MFFSKRFKQTGHRYQKPFSSKFYVQNLYTVICFKVIKSITESVLFVRFVFRTLCRFTNLTCYECDLLYSPQIVPTPPDVIYRLEKSKASCSTCSSLAPSSSSGGSHSQTHSKGTQEKGCANVARPSGMTSAVNRSTGPSKRFSAPPNFYQSTSSPDLTPHHMPRAQTIDTPTHYRYQRSSRLCSDSADEDSSSITLPPSHAASPAHALSEHSGSDFMKRAVAFLRRTGRSKSEQSSNLTSQQPLAMNGHTPSPSPAHAHSSYISSDNDSEFEDADMKKELQKLREK